MKKSHLFCPTVTKHQLQIVYELPVGLDAQSLTFTEFTTEGAVKPLSTVLPAHRRAHWGSAPATSRNTLCLFAHGQGLLEATHTHTHLKFTCVHLRGPLYSTQHMQVFFVALQYGLSSTQKDVEVAPTHILQNKQSSYKLTSSAFCFTRGVTTAPSGRRLSRAVWPSQGMQYEMERMAEGLALPRVRQRRVRNDITAV